MLLNKQRVATHQEALQVMQQWRKELELKPDTYIWPLAEKPGYEEYHAQFSRYSQWAKSLHQRRLDELNRPKREALKKQEMILFVLKFLVVIAGVFILYIFNDLLAYLINHLS